MSIEPGEYCREIEGYLCRKNDGHLIRIVGPAFERVCNWATLGVPLTVAYRGIDRTFERYYRKTSRRRPVRVEFCEADVLDAFDEWRRAVGVILDGAGRAGLKTGPSENRDHEERRESLPAHLRRVAERLSSLAAGNTFDPRLAETIDRTLVEIAALADGARGLRGQARVAALDRLRALDAGLVAAARAVADESTIAALGREAAEELAHFAGRMPPDAYARAVDAARDRLLRERLKLPVLSME